MVPQKHVSIVIPEDYWDDKPKVEFSVLDNYKEVVDAFYRERAEVIEKIETRFGALNTISCIDNEVYFFRYHLIWFVLIILFNFSNLKLNFFFLKNSLLSAEATPSGKLQAEITHAPLSFTIPDQFPVFFYLQSSDLTGKSVTCKSIFFYLNFHFQSILSKKKNNRRSISKRLGDNCIKTIKESSISVAIRLRELY